MTTNQTHDETSAKPAVGRLIEQSGVPQNQQCFEPGCSEQVYRLPGGCMKCLYGHQQIPPHARPTTADPEDDTEQSTSQSDQKVNTQPKRRPTVRKTA